MREVPGSIPGTALLAARFIGCSAFDYLQRALEKRKYSAAGNRTRVIRVTGGYTDHYTITDLRELPSHRNIRNCSRRSSSGRAEER